MEAAQTPTMVHLEFDRICETLDEFEPLPAIRAEAYRYADEDGEETTLDQQILAGLVSPV